MKKIILAMFFAFALSTNIFCLDRDTVYGFDNGDSGRLLIGLTKSYLKYEDPFKNANSDLYEINDMYENSGNYIWHKVSDQQRGDLIGIIDYFKNIKENFYNRNFSGRDIDLSLYPAVSKAMHEEIIKIREANEDLFKRIQKCRLNKRQIRKIEEDLQNGAFLEYTVNPDPRYYGNSGITLIEYADEYCKDQNLHNALISFGKEYGQELALTQEDEEGFDRSEIKNELRTKQSK